MRSDGRTPPWPHAAASALVAPCALTAVVSPAVSAASLQGVAARDSVVNQLLALMDGVANLPVPTFVIALTNRRELVDGAVLRPGRLEVQVAVGKPDETGREAILRIHAEKSAWRPCARPALRSPAGPSFSPAWPGLLTCLARASRLPARRRRPRLCLPTAAHVPHPTRARAVHSARVGAALSRWRGNGQRGGMLTRARRRRRVRFLDQGACRASDARPALAPRTRLAPRASRAPADCLLSPPLEPQGLAANTEGFSGAALAAVVRAAVARALDRSVSLGDAQGCRVSSTDFDSAISDLRTSSYELETWEAEEERTGEDVAEATIAK